jgi:hypothetical protein
MRYVVSPSLVAIAVTLLAGTGALANENPADPAQASATAKPTEAAPAPAPAQTSESPPVLSADEMKLPVAKSSTPAAQAPKHDAATLAVAASVKGKINEEGKICYREAPLGSRTYKKICKTREEIEATAASAQDAMRVMRNTAGSESRQ